jgi:hypothetical protein
MTDRVTDIWGERAPYGQGERRPVRVDQVLAAGAAGSEVELWVQSARVRCGPG